MYFNRDEDLIALLQENCIELYQDLSNLIWRIESKSEH